MTEMTVSRALEAGTYGRLNPEADKIPEFPLFDWLRFALASIVVLSHSGVEFTPGINGGFAVRVFFALSGWLIGSILLQTRTAELPRFYFNRATRIWLPYALAIVLLYGLAALREGIDFYWVKYLVLDTTFTHTLYTFFPAASHEMPLDGSGNQFWSISVEEQFYLFAPLIILFMPGGRHVLTWLAIAVVSIFVGYYFAPIALGVTAAILQRDHAIADNRMVRLAVAVAFLLLLYPVASDSAAPKWLQYLLATVVIVLLAVRGRRTAVATFFGGLSYPLYLNHWIGPFAVHFVAKRYLAIPTPLAITLEYALNVAVAAVLYWLVDRQIQLKRGAWYSKLLGWNLAAAAYALLAIGIVVGGLMHFYGPHATVPAEAQQAPVSPA
jgi:peptidoglycan/LPS O-acetylase OafA/YrhL